MKLKSCIALRRHKDLCDFFGGQNTLPVDGTILQPSVEVIGDDEDNNKSKNIVAEKTLFFDDCAADESVTLFDDGGNWTVGRSWHEALIGTESRKPYFHTIRRFLAAEIAPTFPPQHLIFQWSLLCSFEAVRIVILGQDPYHGDGQAHGLAFSVPKSVPPPPSLRNIFRELAADEALEVPFVAPKHGCLERWSSQGVLLLNATLTVRRNAAASHSNVGWETFTDAVISALCARRRHLPDEPPLVFLLWGRSAFTKEPLIRASQQQHLVLRAPHPSPLSAHRGFIGCRHFSQANAFLKEHGVSPVDWNVDEPRATLSALK